MTVFTLSDLVSSIKGNFDIAIENAITQYEKNPYTPWRGII